MIGFMLLAASVGFLLGLAQFRVTVLLPAFLVLLISVWQFSATADLDGWQTSFAGFLGTVGLQVGYFVAILGRFVRQNKALTAKTVKSKTVKSKNWKATSSAFGPSRFL